MKSTFSLTTLKPTPPSLLIAHKNSRTLVLVLDPAKVPPRMEVLVDGTPRGGSLEDVGTFVQRDLAGTFSNYFKTVKVVGPEGPFPPEPHVVVDVKLDRIEVRVTSQQRDGIVVRSGGYAAMTWGLGVRPSEASDYLYSFAGESAGAPGQEPEVVFRSMFEAAITDMLKGYTDKGVQHQIPETTESPAKPAKVTPI